MDAAEIKADVLRSKKSDWSLLWRVWPFVRPHLGLLLLGFALIPVALLFELAQPYLLKIAIEDYIEPKTLSGMGWIVGVYIACIVLNSVVSLAQLYILQLVGQKSMHNLRTRTYEHVITQGRAFFDYMPVGRLLTRLTTDVESINEMFANGVITLIADMVKLLFIIVVMLSLSVKLTLIVFVTLPLLILIINYARKLMRRSFRAIRVRLAAMSTHMQEHLSGLRVVQLFQMEKQAREEFNEHNAAFRDAYHESIRADASMYALVEAIGVIAIALIAWYATGSAEAAFSVGLIIAFIEYINKFFIPVRDLSAKYGVMQSALAAIERIADLLDDKVEDCPIISDPALANEERDDAPMVTLDNVQFAYRPGDTVLGGVSIEVPRCQHIALVGATGSGKSTIIKLIARLYDAQAGSVQLGGRDVKTMSAGDIRNRMTMVTQDTFLFTGSLRDNVRASKTDATDAQIIDVLDKVGARTLLANRTNESDEVDLDMPIEARGENLSAGERQLVAFARALIRDKELLILDEATAHVDPETEAVIEKALSTMTSGRTTISIAHRLSTIRSADCVIVLSRGKVVESGTYDELVAAGGVFAALERSFRKIH